MNQKKLISALAVISSVLMITVSSLLIFSYVSIESDTDIRGYFTNGFMILVYIFFAIYVLTCFFKEKYKPLGISMVILINYSYFTSFLLYQTLNINLTEILSFVFRTIVVIIFSISLYKSYNKIIFIIGTVAALVSIGIEIKWMYELLLVYLGAFGMFQPINIVRICIDFTGAILFLLTIYFMSFYQKNYIKSKRKLGVNFMIGLGVVLTIAGLASFCYGKSINNDVSTQMNSFFESGKTNTGDNFIAIGVILAIIGIILLICGIVKAVQEDKMLKQSSNERKKCRKCGLTLELGAKFCPFCGESTTNTKMCPKCNAQVPVESKFCNICGESFDDTKVCANCNAKMPKEAKFCNNCGTPFENDTNND